MQTAAGDTFWGMLQARVALTPGRTMLIDEHDRSLTWADFSQWVERVAAGLAEVGIARGSAVSWQLPTRMETIVLSGWFKTGDRGHLRPDGRIAITGRSKELIIRKGENVSPREIEDVLIAHPSVGAVAVIGLPDDERGERVCAVVETAVGAAPLTFQAMVEQCRSAGLMTQKIPEQLELVDVLPRNPTMKILKRELVEQFSPASKGVAR